MFANFQPDSRVLNCKLQRNCGRRSRRCLLGFRCCPGSAHDVAYGMVEAAMKGLIEVLTTQHHYIEACFDIFLIPVGRVGGGRIRISYN